MVVLWDKRVLSLVGMEEVAILFPIDSKMWKMILIGFLEE